MPGSRIGTVGNMFGMPSGNVAVSPTGVPFKFPAWTHPLQPVRVTPFIQGNSITGTAASLTVAFKNNVSVGDLIVVAVGATNNTEPYFNISDTQYNTYYPAGPVVNGGGNTTYSVGIYYATASATGACVITGGTGSGASTANFRLWIHEYAGYNALDQSVGANGLGTTLTAGSMTVTRPNELFFVVGVSSGGVTAASNGWVLRQVVGTQATADMVVSDPGAYTATMPNVTSSGWVSAAASFYAAPLNSYGVTPTSTLNLAATRYDSVVLRDAPSGYWILNETAGTNATDSSGNARTGTYTGGFTLAARADPLQGFTDTVATFNGSTGYVNVPATGLTVTTAGFSFETWYFPTAFTGAPALISNAGSAISLNVGAGGIPGFAVTFNPSLPLIQRAAAGTTALTINKWYHMVGTFDGVTISCYVNGVLVGTANNIGTSGVLNSGAGPWGLGSTISTHFLPGSLAHAQIYVGKVLSPADVSRHYAAGISTTVMTPQRAIGEIKTGNLVASTSPYVDVVRNDQPNIYWRLDETTGTTAYDVLNTTPGIYQGGFTLAQPGALTTEPDYATAFNGTTGYVQVPHTSALDVGDVMSMECWVNANNFTGTPILITNNTGSYILRLETTGAWTLRKGAAANIVTSTTTLNTGQWYHLVVAKNGATVNLYQNGVDVTGAVVNATLTNNTFGLALAAATSGISNVGTTPFFSGTLDEVAIYPYALTQAQAQNHYNAATSVSGLTKGTNSTQSGSLQSSGSMLRSMYTNLVGVLQSVGNLITTYIPLSGNQFTQALAGNLVATGGALSKVIGTRLFGHLQVAPIPASAQLVAQGAATTGALGAALTPSWPAGATRQPGNLLVCWAFLWGHSGQPGVPPPGWTLAGYIGSATFFNSAFILTKVATGGDAAPTLPVSAGATWGACLAEFTPTGPLDRSAGLTNASGSFTIVANGADQSAGELVLYADTISYSAAATKGITSSLNNGATDHNTNSSAISTANHYSFGWGVTTGNSASDSETTAVTGTGLTGISSVIVSVNQTQPFAKSTSHGLLGTLQAVGTTTKRTVRTVTGAVRGTGSMIKSVRTNLVGTLSMAGVAAFTHLLNVILTAALVLGGSISNRISKIVTGAMQMTGAITRQITHGLTGVLRATGAQARSIVHQLVGALRASGATTKRTLRTLVGTLQTAGAVTTSAVHFYTQLLTANLVAAGAVAGKTVHNVIMNASFIAQGILTRLVSHGMAAAFVASGAIIRRTTHLLASALTLSSAMPRVIRKGITGSMRATGALVSGIFHVMALAGNLAIQGSLIAGRHLVQLLNATLQATGAINKSIRKGLTGAVSWVGSLIENWIGGKPSPQPSTTTAHRGMGRRFLQSMPVPTPVVKAAQTVFRGATRRSATGILPPETPEESQTKRRGFGR